MEDHKSWAEMFPNGRHIFYEGDDAEGFARQIKTEFGFDPSQDPKWSDGHGFDCPPEHLDAIYGARRFPLGS